MIKPTFPISRTSYVVQTDGVHLGRAMFRVQFADEFCGITQALMDGNKELFESAVQKLDAYGLVERMKAVAAPDTFMLLAGEEPARFKLDSIVQLSRAAGHNVHVETGGFNPLPNSIDWITVCFDSDGQWPRVENVRRANEFKVLCRSKESMEAAINFLLPDKRDRAPVWLVPAFEQGKPMDTELLNAVIGRVKSDNRMRLGYPMFLNYEDLQGDNAGS